MAGPSDAAADGAEGLAAALTAVRLDEQNPYAHYGLAIVSIYGGNLDQAKRAAERAIEASASFALGHLVLGMALLFSGDADAAVGALERGLELSPHDPQNFIWLNLLALARALSGDAAAGLEAAQQVVKVRPDWRPGFETLAYCQALLGRHDEARRSVRHLTALDAFRATPWLRCDPPTRFGSAISPKRCASYKLRLKPRTTRRTVRFWREAELVMRPHAFG